MAVSLCMLSVQIILLLFLCIVSYCLQSPYFKSVSCGNIIPVLPVTAQLPKKFQRRRERYSCILYSKLVFHLHCSTSFFLPFSKMLCTILGCDAVFVQAVLPLDFPTWCACMHVCLFVCMYVCVYKYICVCVCVSL